MKPLSQAVTNTKKSSIRKLFELVLTAKDAISLGIGQPDFPTPDNVLAGIRRGLDERKTMYAPTLGLPELRELAARKFREENSLDWVQPQNVIITNGGSQGIQLAYAALTNPGDEVIISSPNFLSYYYVAGFHKVRVSEVPRKNDFSLDLEGIRAAVSEKTKFILINSPNNPTGYAFSKQEMDEIVSIMLENDLYLVSDEVYEKFLYQGRKHMSPGFYEGMAGRTITLNAMSKTFAATGLRCGYVAAPVDVINLMEKYAQYTSAGVNHPTQIGAIEGLRTGNPLIDKIVAQYDQKRKYCEKRLGEMGFDCPTGYGAFYLMPSVTKFCKTSEEFSTRLMQEQEVAVVPGDAFGSHSNDRVRMSYATTDENLEVAFDRIEKFIRSL